MIERALPYSAFIAESLGGAADGSRSPDPRVCCPSLNAAAHVRSFRQSLVREGVLKSRDLARFSNGNQIAYRP